ncbi:MAG: ATP-grasp domain-containing protein [Erysipelotrichia bacterium]|nr:ATP-grasp domain-containing protein [Erysipelotrichia bacterium]NCC54276.1 ATP-grasp domain-containing protein [Erysipelotrichia bacterium]
MNFIFISPNFPDSYWNFCRALKRNGVNILAIGDCPYEKLNPNLKKSLNEYYKVSSLENYDEVYRGCAFLAFKHGKIDWLESNNEYWLERDAKLRSDFNITTGIQSHSIQHIKYKSKMKEYFIKAGVKVARYHLMKDFVDGLAFTKEVGYPVVVKPDNGVGASTTYKINNDEELRDFYHQLKDTPFIMEEYVDGTTLSFDGIAGKKREIIFATAHYYPDSIMDLVNQQKDVWFYSLKQIPEDLAKVGKRVIETFESNCRFFHCEYFRLNKDKEGLGKKGDLIALEVNMRPPGGYIPDMINYANEVDVYQLWADMVTYNKGMYDADKRPYSCVYAARRNTHHYQYAQEKIKEKYKTQLRLVQNNPDVIARAMGDSAYIACFKSEDEAIQFAHMILKKK